MNMQELNFEIEASIERWLEWYHVVCDEDSDSCCRLYELNDPLLLNIIKYGCVDIELALPLSDYFCVNGQSSEAPPCETAPEDEYVPV